MTPADSYYFMDIERERDKIVCREWTWNENVVQNKWSKYWLIGNRFTFPARKTINDGDIAGNFVLLSSTIFRPFVWPFKERYQNNRYRDLILRTRFDTFDTMEGKELRGHKSLE